MVAAAKPPNEAERLKALLSYEILDTDFEKDYDDLCRLAAVLCGTPVALISFSDSDRQWFKSSVGMAHRETPRDIALCAHAIWHDKIFEIRDASQDERFFDNPQVTADPGIRFYAGQPLMTDDGFALGTLCTIDHVPRVLSDEQREALAILARQVVTHLELRRSLVELRHLNGDKDRFFSIIAHDLRSPFAGLLGLVDLMRSRGSALDKGELLHFVDLIHDSLKNIFNLSENLLKWALVEQGKMSFQEESLPLRVLFDEVSAPLLEALNHKRLKLVTAFDQEAEVRGDRNMLETALRNLVSNAAKYTKAGSIVLSAEKRGAEWRLSVQDSGLGMTPGELETLVSGFKVTSRKGTAGEPGTGLGLTLVRQFAARHGGRLELESEPGVGTKATLVIPAE